MMFEYYPRVLAVIAVLIFFGSVDQYLFSAEILPIPPLYWIITYGILALPVLFSRATLSTIRGVPLVMSLYGFLMASGLWFLLQPIHSDVMSQELQTRTLSVLFTLMLLPILFRQDAQVWAKRTVLAAVIVAVSLNIYELFHPMTFSSVVGRSAGLYINPNRSGIALVLGMIISQGLLRHRYRLVFLLFVGLGVFLTFSRGSIAGWFISVLMIVLTRQVKLRKSLIVASVALTLTAVGLIWQWDMVQQKLEDIGGLNRNVISRVEWFQKPKIEDDITEGREQVAELAWQMFADAPVFGHGVGASVDWQADLSSHNQFLNLMVDHGIFGFFIFPAIILAIVWRARGETKLMGLTFAVFIFFTSMFSHNLLADRSVLSIYALIAAAVMASRAPSVLNYNPLVRKTIIPSAPHPSKAAFDPARISCSIGVNQ